MSTIGKHKIGIVFSLVNELDGDYWPNTSLQFIKD